MAQTSPDKEMWERAGFPNYPRYEYVPLPKEVVRVLKRKYKDYVLMSYYWTDDKGRKVAFLEYISYDRMNVHRGPGYCCDRIDDPDMWSQVARSLAMDNIKLRTRSFNKESVPIAPYTFSIGDRIRLKGNTYDTIGHCIVDIREGYYWCDADITIPISCQDRYEKF